MVKIEWKNMNTLWKLTKAERNSIENTIKQLEIGINQAIDDCQRYNNLLQTAIHIRETKKKELNRIKERFKID